MSCSHFPVAHSASSHSKLLIDMGWEEGTGIGASPGMTEPVGATIKLTKNGVGFLTAWEKAEKLKKAAAGSQAVEASSS